MTTRDRRLARAERLAEWADKRDAKAAADYAVGDPYRGDIAFNTQPGHIPERARVIRATERAWEHTEKANSMRSRAASIEAATDESIFDDDPDAIERLTEKLAALEAKRERMKQRNAAYRKEHKAELKAMSAYERSQAVPHAGWELTNLGGVIANTRKRIAVLERRKATTGTTAKPARGLTLRYAGTCAACGTELAQGVFAYYDRSERTVTCAACHQQEGSA